MKKYVPAVADVKEFRPLQVTLDEVDGSFDRMLRRFIRKSKDDGVLDEVRDRRGYRKPSEERRRSVKRAPR